MHACIRLRRDTYVIVCACQAAVSSLGAHLGGVLAIWGERKTTRIFIFTTTVHALEYNSNSE